MEVLPKAPGVWTVRLPLDGRYALNLPIKRKHVLLSFALPVDIAGIRLEGNALESAALYAGAVDPKEGFDPGTLHELGEQRNGIAWDISGREWARRITTLRIAPVITMNGPPQGDAVEFTLSIDFGPKAVNL